MTTIKLAAKLSVVKTQAKRVSEKGYENGRMHLPEHSSRPPRSHR